MRTHRLFPFVLAGLLGALLASPVSAADPTCETPEAADGNEPLCNPYLADSPWPGNHRTSYAQASSAFPGVAAPPEQINVDHEFIQSAPIVVSFSPEYPDGKRVLWASTVGFTGEVVKFDPDTTKVIDRYVPAQEEGSGGGNATVSGAYNLVDAENRLHVGQASALEVYGDENPGEWDSPIALLKRFSLPDEALCGEDQLVGITMTYDGHIAFATENGIVGTVPRDPAQMAPENLALHSLNGPDCAGGPDGEVETVSNSIAADEHGGIYVVSSHAMYRLDWDGTSLTEGWRSTYAGAGGSGGGRLGAGSGSTPSLMGTDVDEDRFVVITDGQELMHLVLMWRDEIPAGWEPIRDGADPRIACEIPVTFGDPEAERSLSEQSVLVRGHSAVVVNNLMQFDPVLGQFPSQLAPFTQLLSGLPGNAPTGLERFAWDPATQTCDVVWSNPDVAIPNGIPTMSAATNLIYGIGSRDGVWTLEGIDWDTGDVELTVETTAFPSSNSFYAATTVGPDQTIWTGNFGGVTRFQQCDPAVESDCGRRLDPIEAGLGQTPLEDITEGGADDGGSDGSGGSDGGSGGEGDTEDDSDVAGDDQGNGSLPSTGGGAAVGALLSAVAVVVRRRYL